MTPTSELRTQLRALIDEAIPPGGTDADTRFSDAEIEAFLLAAATLNAAAAAGWMAKAGKAAGERGGLIEVGVGTERMRWISPVDYREHCIAMAGYYSDLAGTGSRLFALAERDVLGLAAYARTTPV